MLDVRAAPNAALLGSDTLWRAVATYRAGRVAGDLDELGVSSIFGHFETFNAIFLQDTGKFHAQLASGPLKYVRPRQIGWRGLQWLRVVRLPISG
jgi:hypothetical protein